MQDQDPAEYHEPLLYDFHDGPIPTSFFPLSNRLHHDIYYSLEHIDLDFGSLPLPSFNESSCIDLTAFSDVDEIDEPFMAWSSSSEDDEDEILRQDYLEYLGDK